MNNIFSLRRIGLMLNADWIEYKHFFFLFVVLILAINTFLFLDSSKWGQIIIFSVSFIFMLSFFLILVGRKVNHSKSQFLTIPASEIEKFIELLFVWFIYLCVLILIHVIVLGVSFIFNDMQLWFTGDFRLNTNSTVSIFGILKYTMGIILFICTFLFMCSIAIQKYSLPLGILFLILYGMTCIYTYSILFVIESFKFLNSTESFMSSNAMIETMFFFSTYSPWILCIASVVLLYISYLKLKEKQIR